MISKIEYNNFSSLFLIFTMCLFLYSCKKDVYGCVDINADNYDNEATKDDSSCIYTSLKINFANLVDGAELVYGNNNFLYTNSIGANYSVSRILYVLSDITLYFQNDEIVNYQDIIFVNSENNETLFHEFDNLPGLCVGIGFRLGFLTENNVDFFYINQEFNFHDLMKWPNSFGQSSSLINQPGGYHYMKIEGRYINAQGQEIGYNTHSGPTNGNDFSILYSQFNFNPSAEITLLMNVNNWYDNPIHNIKPAIMEDVESQTNLFQNANNVFSIITQY